MKLILSNIKKTGIYWFVNVVYIDNSFGKCR